MPRPSASKAGLPGRGARAPSIASPCGATSFSWIRFGSHFRNGSARPPSKAMPGAPTASSRSAMRAAPSAAASMTATPIASPLAAESSTKGASCAKSAGRAWSAQVTTFGGSWSKRSRICLARSVIGAMPSWAQSARRIACLPISLPLASSEMTLPQPPTLKRRPLTTARPAEPVPMIRIAPSPPAKAPSQAI